MPGVSDRSINSGKHIRILAVNFHADSGVGRAEAEGTSLRRSFRHLVTAGKLKNIQQLDFSFFIQKSVQAGVRPVHPRGAVQIVADRTAGIGLHAGVHPDICPYGKAGCNVLDRKIFRREFANITFFCVQKEKDGAFVLVPVITGGEQFFALFDRLRCSIATVQYGAEKFQRRFFLVVGGGIDTQFPAVHCTGKTGRSHPHSGLTAVPDGDPLARRIFRAEYDATFSGERIPVFVQDIGIVFGQIGKHDPTGTFMLKLRDLFIFRRHRNTGAEQPRKNDQSHPTDSFHKTLL